VLKKDIIRNCTYISYCYFYNSFAR